MDRRLKKNDLVPCLLLEDPPPPPPPSEPDAEGDDMSADPPLLLAAAPPVVDPPRGCDNFGSVLLDIGRPDMAAGELPVRACCEVVDE